MEKSKGMLPSRLDYSFFAHFFMLYQSKRVQSTDGRDGYEEHNKSSLGVVQISTIEEDVIMLD